MRVTKRRLLQGGHFGGELPSVGDAEETGPFLVKIPQHAAVGQQLQAHLTGAEENTEDYTAARKD